MCIDRKISLTTLVRFNVFHHGIHYYCGTSSCYETLAVPGMLIHASYANFTTKLRFNVYQKLFSKIQLCITCSCPIIVA